MTLHWSPVAPTPDFLGESPVWDHCNRLIYWIDGVSRTIRCHDPATGAFDTWDAPSMAGSIALGGRPPNEHAAEAILSRAGITFPAVLGRGKGVVALDAENRG